MQEVTSALLSLAGKMLGLWTPALCPPSTPLVGTWLELEQPLESYIVKMGKLPHQPGLLCERGMQLQIV